MTIETQTNKVQYLGDGAARVFPVPFPVGLPGHLRLYLWDGRTQAEIFNFSVTGAGTASVSVALDSPPAAGRRLTILREVPYTQPMDLRNGGAFDAEILEGAADNLEMQIQQLQEALGRAIVAPESFEGAGVKYEDMLALKEAAESAAHEAAERTAGLLSGYVAAGRDAKDGAEAAEAGAETARGEAEAAKSGADDAAALARKWAANPEDAAVQSGLYSARHYAAKAAASAEAAEAATGIGLATNNKPGLVKGEGETPGKVRVEPDGSMAVNGPLPVALGGTGAATAAGTIRALGLRAAAAEAIGIYVRTDGDNANDGFMDSAAGAVRDWDGVLAALGKMDARQNNVWIRFGAGSWPGFTIYGNLLPGQREVIIAGAGKDQTEFTSTVAAYDIRAQLQNCALNALNAVTKASVELSGCAVKGSGGFGLRAARGSEIVVTNGLEFKGTFTNAIYALYSGSFIECLTTVTFTGAVNVTGEFALASMGGAIRLDGAAFAGSFTGRKWRANAGGLFPAMAPKGGLNDSIPGTLGGIIDGTASIGGGFAPQPVTNGDVGHWAQLASAAGAACALSGGGTWAYFLMALNASWSLTSYVTKCGIAAGGTTVAEAAAGVAHRGFAWRIA